MMLNTLQFKSYYKLWHSYITRSTPEGNFYELRNGYKLYLSSSDEDPVTVMVVFGKRDYGKIKKGDVVVDIGANIGSYSIYAAKKGAIKVYAFEPNKEAFKTLKKNVEENGLQNIVKAINAAVTDKDGEWVSITTSSSPRNEIIRESKTEGTDTVSSISLQKIIESNHIDQIDILKVDCEGCEHVIFKSVNPEYFNRIKEIRMEVHGSDSSCGNLLDELTKHYKVIKQNDTIYWLEKN